MAIYPGYGKPVCHERYGEIAKRIGAPTHDVNGLIAMILNLMKKLDMPLTFKAANVNEALFLEKIDQLAEDAFDDQCTPGNPRFPIIPELKEILLQAYHGVEE